MTKKVKMDVSDDERLSDLNAELELIERRMTKYHNAIREINVNLGAIEARKRVVKYQAHELQNRLFAHYVVETPEFQKVHSARDLFFRKLNAAQSEHITVAKKKQLEALLTPALSELRSICKHPFVFSYDGYRGSASDDWDDARHGYRVCTVCNLRELSTTTDKDTYAILTQDETRLVRRDVRRAKDIPSSYNLEWFNVAFLEELFARSAGGRNIDWPDVIDQKAVSAQ